MREPLLVTTPAGLYCPAGDFYIDPSRGVETAVVTHAHADHARRGSATYWCARPGAELLRLRVDPRGEAEIQAAEFGVPHLINGVEVSFHPAGHILGSAQVRVAHGGEVWVATGDYKRVADASCRPFEPVPCDVLITEATFGIPVYRWRPDAEVLAEFLDWWRANAAAGRPSVVRAYSLGKTQRILAAFEAMDVKLPGPLLVHRAAWALCQAYRRQGVKLGNLGLLDFDHPRKALGRALCVGPATPDGWAERVGARTAFASGWMRVRGHRRRDGGDRGFVLSDHADWPGLLRTVRESGAQRVHVMYAPNDVFARRLAELGYDTRPLDVWSEAP